MNSEAKSILEKQIYKLNTIDGYLDIARDCFSHFQHFQPTQTELDQYSTKGHDTVESCRKAIRDVVVALERIQDSN